MIDVLVAGKFVGAAVERAASSGRTFVTSKLRAADSDGEGQIVNVVAFDEGVKCALLALDDGDGVSVSGAMKVGTYEARDASTRISINVVASAALTVFHVKRKRQAVAQASDPKAEATRASAAGKRNGLRAVRGNSTTATIEDDDVGF